jgi:hypothetical protein
VVLGAVWAPTVLWCLGVAFYVGSMVPDAADRAAGFTLTLAASLPVVLLPISALLALWLRHAGHRLAFERGGMGLESGRGTSPVPSLRCGTAPAWGRSCGADARSRRGGSYGCAH